LRPFGFSRKAFRISGVASSVDVTPVGAVIDAALRRGALRDLTIEDPPLDEIIQAF